MLNLLTNCPLSWTPSTADKFVNPNHTVSVDWGIINKRNKARALNVFALFLDIHTGLVFVYPAESRGQASEALKTYIQRYGKPHALIHDNAKEFVEGGLSSQKSASNKESTKQEVHHMNPIKTP